MKKKFLLLMMVFAPFFVKAQAHLGSTEAQIKKLYPNKTFETGYTDDGDKYISTFQQYGTFFYYFEKKTGLTNFCMQVIDEIPYLNGQVEAYNNKYVIVSDTQWKAYLEGGGLLKIELEYNKEHEVYVFYYTD